MLLRVLRGTWYNQAVERFLVTYTLRIQFVQKIGALPFWLHSSGDSPVKELIQWTLLPFGASNMSEGEATQGRVQPHISHGFWYRHSILENLTWQNILDGLDSLLAFGPQNIWINWLHEQLFSVRDQYSRRLLYQAWRAQGQWSLRCAAAGIHPRLCVGKNDPWEQIWEVWTCYLRS